MTIVDIKGFQSSSKVVNGSKCRYQREEKDLRASVLAHATYSSKAIGATASDCYAAVMEACLASMEGRPQTPRQPRGQVIDFLKAKARRQRARYLPEEKKETA